MSDLLGSILRTMETPPSIGTKEEHKKQAEQFRKLEEQSKQQLSKFRKQIEERIHKFINDGRQSSYKFEPMDKVHRTILHDVADAADLTAFSFGLENIDRHTVVYKYDSVPSEEELACLRRGEVYDPERERLKKVLEAKEEMDSLKKRKNQAPASDYHEKYQHLIGKDAGVKAAIAAVPNQSFGIVPSSLKRDQRSIEETLNDIKKKKKQRPESQSNQLGEETISPSINDHADEKKPDNEDG